MKKASLMAMAMAMAASACMDSNNDRHIYTRKMKDTNPIHLSNKPNRKRGKYKPNQFKKRKGK